MRRARFSRLFILVLVLSVLVLGCGNASPSNPDQDSSSTPGPLPRGGELLFVIEGPVTLDNGRITIEAETLEWFTDKPERKAGKATVRSLISNWDFYGFDDSPPNAAISAKDAEDVLELSSPRTEDAGISFDYSQISGDPPAEGEPVSFFIDATNPYRTSMRVYVHASDYCNTALDGEGAGATTVYKNPQITKAPNAWIHEPIETATFPDPDKYGDPIELFNAAARKGSVSFEVRYDIHCITDYGADKGPNGQMSFKGTVGDTFNQSNKFTCGYVWGGSPYGRYACKDDVAKGYHVDANARPYATGED